MFVDQMPYSLVSLGSLNACLLPIMDLFEEKDGGKVYTFFYCLLACSMCIAKNSLSSILMDVNGYCIYNHSSPQHRGRSPVSFPTWYKGPNVKFVYSFFFCTHLFTHLFHKYFGYPLCGRPSCWHWRYSI